MSRNATLVRAMLAAAVLSPAALAQLNVQWATFVQESSRFRDATGAPAAYITGDNEEKDFAMGDLDQDGWTDLIVMRKQPASTSGAFPNFLLMNEGGLLVDRTAQYASASDVAGDNGFLTPTNDRDAVVVDVNADGWDDVVTATTLSGGQPKHISHPRVYMNLGNDGNGDWLGLRFENARMPTFAGTPFFCAVAAGDISGDGSPDLYFADYGQVTDRLLINDGNGFFNDSGTTRMTNTMLNQTFGSAAIIADMNGDGFKDVVKSSGVTDICGNGGSGSVVSIAYNNPSNVGFFPSGTYQNSVGSGAPYHVDVGDLNNDTRPDIIVSDDGADTHRYNTGNDGLGRVIWGPIKSFAFAGGNDDGFAGTNHVVDVDGDGWQDAVIADFDVDVGGCGRRGRVYHNPGGAVGSQPTLKEEAQQAGSGGWKGVTGMLAGDQTGTFDIAVFDIDNDGDNDMVWGRCAGTFVWINQKFSCPAIAYSYGTAAQNSSGFGGHISMTGSASISANDLVFHGTNFPPNKTALFLYGTTRLFNPLPFGNGLRWIGGTLKRLAPFQTDSSGNVLFPTDMTTNPLNTIAPGDVRGFQLWFRDPPAGGALYNASDALEITFCP